MTATPLPTCSFQVSRADLRRYANASGDHNPIHLSESAAAAAGLPDVVAHGMLTMGLALRAIEQWAGSPAAVLRSTARFLRPVPVGADESVVLEIDGVVRPESADTVKAELSVRCAGQPVAAVVAVVRTGPGDPHVGR